MGIKNVTRKTILYVDYNDVQDFIENYFPIDGEYCIPAEEEVGNDVILEFDIDGELDEFDKKDYAEAVKKNKWPQWRSTRLFLNVAANDGEIEKGIYMVKVSW